MNRLLGVMLATVLSSPAHAVFLGGVGQTFGKDEYKGTSVHAGVNLGAFSITPEYNRAQDKNSNGAISAAQLRLGMDTRWAGIGASAGRTFPHQRYSNYFGGADVSFTISPMGEGGVRRIGGPGRGGAPTGKGLARVDFGGGLLHTQHREEATGATAEKKLGQNDIHAFVGASFLNVLLSGRLAKSAYSKDLNTAAAPYPGRTLITGHLPIGGSFPDTSLHLSGEFTAFPMVAPYATYTVTQFKEIASVKAPETKAVGLGLRVGLEMLAVNASWQRIAWTGNNASFFNLGADLRF
ncbi:MAG: hypothetical protein AAB578_05710 [Elusimicrobiota bacterium]